MLAGLLLESKAPTPAGLDTRGYNTEHYPTERLLACKLSGYWTIRSPECKARQIAANTKHGRKTRAIREERSAKLAELYEIEKEMRSMGMVEGSWVSRKPPSR